jgi:hypothetical protein
MPEKNRPPRPDTAAADEMPDRLASDERIQARGSPQDRSCQNTQMTDEGEGSLTAAIADELATCRQRGIERLEVRSHSQVPVQTPVLQRLAKEYVTASQLRAQDRVTQLKYLLRDALRAFATENEADAQLASALFFGDSQNRVTKSAGELLDIARTEFKFVNEARFRQARHDAFERLASFIPAFVAGVARKDEEPTPVELDSVSDAASETVPQQLSADRNDSVLDPEVQRHVATTGYIDNGQHFITLLAQAASATIVGFTNENLATMLRTALERKRAAMLKPDVCWDSIRIVFLSDRLLDSINDERGEHLDPDQALQRRHRAKVHGRRTVGIFLRSLPPSRWEIYDSHYFPPLFGTLFEMPGGQRIVQLLIRRSQSNSLDHLYLELDDTRGHYFSAAFEEIVHSSVDDNKLVPVGVAIGQRFRVTSTRHRLNLLMDGSQATGWLAVVLVITWRVRNGKAEPLLQLRTRLNSAREFDRLSHPASHVILDDSTQTVAEFGLDDEMPLAAARRRIRFEAGEGEPGELRPLGTCTYIHSDKEHLFFFIYTCELPDGFQFWRQADIYPVPVTTLLSIRKNQALRKALALCESPPSGRSVRAAAFEVAALNLVLHGYTEIAQRLRRAATQRTSDSANLAVDIRDLEEQTQHSWPGSEEEVQIQGLAGLHYREFFTILLPFYADVGIPGAAEVLRRVNDDQAMRAAVVRLSELYHNEALMGRIPLELLPFPSPPVVRERAAPFGRNG